MSQQQQQRKKTLLGKRQREPLADEQKKTYKDLPEDVLVHSFSFLTLRELGQSVTINRISRTASTEAFRQLIKLPLIEGETPSQTFYAHPELRDRSRYYRDVAWYKLVTTTMVSQFREITRNAPSRSRPYLPRIVIGIAQVRQHSAWEILFCHPKFFQRVTWFLKRPSSYDYAGGMRGMLFGSPMVLQWDARHYDLATVDAIARDEKAMEALVPDRDRPDASDILGCVLTNSHILRIYRKGMLSAAALRYVDLLQLLCDFEFGARLADESVANASIVYGFFDRVTTLGIGDSPDYTFYPDWQSETDRARLASNLIG